ncbi:flagellar basal-body rod modification protein FlgD [Paracoccus thiocyanatus]|uniref:Basal-body rod modification protein FlgD n=2 Tax=Paracoccus thiocyanatus TaxID=34006 RepID=A0A1N6SU10_9RHOB|nr:flagellar basal-body rod modification protein FlgD [Paracoccus thiocyanatus]
MVSMNTAPAVNVAAAAMGQGAYSSAEAASTSQFEVFLKMLTTQIKNQDPLNPMESTEFAVQLATFSGVEQQVQTNALLANLLNNINGGELGQLSNWIGREVRSSAPVWFEDAPLTLAVENNGGPATLVTRDASGNAVLRQDVGTFSGEMTWTGMKDNGSRLPGGFYSFQIEETGSDGGITTRNVEAYSRVVGVELKPAGAELLVSGGGLLAASEVTALRE